MSRVLAPVMDLIESAVDLYRDSALCRALCLGIGLLTGLLILDAIMGFPTGTRMVYVLPLWLATKRGGRNAGATLVVVSTISLALIDTLREGRTNSMLVNCALQTTVLYGLMLIFDKLETDMRTVKTLATRDALTGLLNRFALDERARKAVDRALLLNQPLALAMVDCDRFKELNDQFGHAFGDDVLRLLAKTLRRGLTAEATVGRAGGDEFIIVLPNRDRMEAMSLFEAAQDRFMSHADIVGRSTGFSYGIAVLGDDGCEYERLLRAADEDMYRRKADRSAVSESLAS